MELKDRVLVASMVSTVLLQELERRGKFTEEEIHRAATLAEWGYVNVQEVIGAEEMLVSALLDIGERAMRGELQ